MEMEALFPSRPSQRDFLAEYALLADDEDEGVDLFDEQDDDEEDEPDDGPDIADLIAVGKDNDDDDADAAPHKALDAARRVAEEKQIKALASRFEARARAGEGAYDVEYDDDEYGTELRARARSAAEKRAATERAAAEAEVARERAAQQQREERQAAALYQLYDLYAEPSELTSDPPPQAVGAARAKRVPPEAAPARYRIKKKKAA